MEVLEIKINKEQNIENAENSWRIIFQCDGKSVVTLNEKIIYMDKKDICIIPPKNPFQLIPEEGASEYYFSTNEFRPFGESRVYCLRDDVCDSVREVLDLIFRYRLRGSLPINYAIIKSLGDALYHMLAELYTRNQERDFRLQKIMDTMYTNIPNPDFDLRTCLEDSGYSVSYLRKLFLHIVGMTPSKYMNRIRIERTKSLIQQYGYSRSLKEIALSCGFRDALYFSRVFHKIEGIGPQEYRNRNIHKKDK